MAQLGAHGFVRGSFVPPAPIRAPRDLTRTRTALTRERAREVQRLEKLLEGAGIKLSAVATDIVGVSGRARFEALFAGQRDPAVLADLAKRKLRWQLGELTEALIGRFEDHHAFLARIHLDLIDHLTEAIDQVTTRIEDAMAPFHDVRDLICTIPGVSTLVADVIIAETGADMPQFPSPGHLASWAGTCPGADEPAGRVKSTHTRPANPYLKGALGVAAMAEASTKGTYLAAERRRVAARPGPLKAVVAVEHAMLIVIWHMINDEALYRDPGAAYYTRLNPDKIKNRAIDQLTAIGYTVTLTPDPSQTRSQGESSRQEHVRCMRHGFGTKPGG